jgi:hypothetical protein
LDASLDLLVLSRDRKLPMATTPIVDGYPMNRLLPFRRPPKRQESGKGRATFDDA